MTCSFEISTCRAAPSANWSARVSAPMRSMVPRAACWRPLVCFVPPFPPRLEESAPRLGFFEHAEYLAVRQHLTPAVYQGVLDFAYYSGWRRGEITGLTWREIEMAGGVIRLDPDRSKTKTGRVLPVSEPLKEVLQRRIAARRLDSLLVFHRNGKPTIDWRKAWAAACKLAGLPGKRLHDCRRTPARNLIRSGTPERVGDAAHRSQDALGLRPLQHRERERSEGWRGSTRGLRQEATEGTDCRAAHEDGKRASIE